MKLFSHLRRPHASPRSRRSLPPWRFRPGVEPLAERVLPAYTVTFTGGILTLTADAANDTIRLTQNSSGGILESNSTLPGSPNLNNTTQIHVLGGGGTDNISINLQGFNGTVTLNGEDGNDTLAGGATADTLIGGNGDDTLIGGAALDRLEGGNGTDFLRGGVTQAVFLDFDSQTGGGEHVYTTSERDGIQARLEADMAPFDFTFTQTAPSLPFTTLFFNKGNPFGLADEIDFRNVNLGATASINITGTLGGGGQPPANSPNIISVSANVAGHELGHLLGLRHGDSFGPIGTGLYSTINDADFSPTYPGPESANETLDHLMETWSSTSFLAGNDQFWGEREAVKLAFNDTGRVVGEQSASHGGIGSAQPADLANLSVPNTLLDGDNDGLALRGRATVVLGNIGSGGQIDFYSFQGVAGEVFNLEVISLVLERISNPINPEVRVYDANGDLLDYFGTTAFNNDEWETPDSILIDLELPATGTYYVSVEAVSGSDTGTYELFMQTFGVGDSSGAGDSIFGGDGPDTLRGSSGDDLLDGGNGNDSIDARDGNDTLTGGAGNDTLNAGAGTDRVAESADADLTLTNTSLTGAGTDSLVSIEQGELSGGAGANTLTASSFSGPVTLLGQGGADTLIGANGDDLLDGGAGNDSLTSGNGNDTLLGGDGDDSVIPGNGNDSAAGGNGNDTLLGANGNDTLQGDEGADSVVGDAGNDSLDGGNANDILSGGAGNDTLFGGEANYTALQGFDLMFGGDGDDTLTGGKGSDCLYGGEGNDTLSGENGTDSVFGDNGNDSVVGARGKDTIFGGNGNDTLNGAVDIDSCLGGDGDDSILGSDGRDYLQGGAGNDTLKGGEGYDLLDGGDGNDSLDGGNGNDSILGGFGNDTLSGNNGNDTLSGDSGNDSILGGDGDDSLLGGDGDDTVRGENGNDTLRGGAGVDVLDGGAGSNDIFDP